MKSLFFVLILGGMLISCSSQSKEPKKAVEWSQQKSADFGKEMAKDEAIEIKLFLASHRDWKMEETGTGLQYFIYKHGEGEFAKTRKLAEVKFKINLLNGEECYQTNANETEKFEIDHSEVESGIQEGIKRMRVGDKAKMIIPSHLAHGLVGDMNKIPPLTTIVVDLELINLLK